MRLKEKELRTAHLQDWLPDITSEERIHLSSNNSCPEQQPDGYAWCGTANKTYSPVEYLAISSIGRRYSLRQLITMGDALNYIGAGGRTIAEMRSPASTW